MKTYYVKWEINALEATNPADAAQKALDYIKNSASIAHVFEVTDEKTNKTKTIDLNDFE